jgi:predicted outer membrane repeat protein
MYCLSCLLLDARRTHLSMPASLCSPQNGSETTIVGATFTNNKAGLAGGALRAQVQAVHAKLKAAALRLPLTHPPLG